MLLNKVGNKNDKLRDLNDKLKYYINDLKVFMCAKEETLIFCS
jgi:hypothetical protein